MSDFAKWLPYLGAVVFDDERGLRVALPFVGNENDEARRRLVVSAIYAKDRRGVPEPEATGVRAAKLKILAGTDANDAFGLTRIKGGQSSQRRMLMAVDCLIEHRLRPSNKSDSATAKAWKERIENVGTARRKHAKEAGELLTIWIRWAREQCGIVGHSDEAILQAHLKAIRETREKWYPPDRVPKPKIN